MFIAPENKEPLKNKYIIQNTHKPEETKEGTKPETNHKYFKTNINLRKRQKARNLRNNSKTKFDETTEGNKL